MRSIKEIKSRIEQETEQRLIDLLRDGFDQQPALLVSRLTTAYEVAYNNAWHHRTNGIGIMKLSGYAWLAGSDLEISQIPWLQFGMPRVKAIAVDLKLPWPFNDELKQSVTKVNRMAQGLPCTNDCLRCAK